ETLERIGGLKAFVNVLADDHAIGHAVRGLGLEVAIPSFVVEHGCSEPGWSSLISHELRWARTIKGIDPAGFVGSAATHPLPFALLALALSPSTTAVIVLILALACRVIVQIQVDRTLSVVDRRWLWGPARDVLSFGVFVASLWPGTVK